MSIDLLYKQDLGIIYDTINIFAMKLNPKSTWINRGTQESTKTEDETYLDYWLNQFESLPQELMIFFYLKDQRVFGFFIHAFAEILQKTSVKASINDFLKYISDEEIIKADISRFYFGKILSDSNAFEEELSQRDDLDSLLRYYLLGFAVNPGKYLKLLYNKFTEFYNRVEEIYREKATVLLKQQEKLTGEIVCNVISKYLHSTVIETSINSKQQIIYSFTIVAKNCIMFEVEKPMKWCVLGIEYDRQVKADDELVVDIAALGNAFGDKHRFDIINLLLQYGEMCPSEFANRLGLAANSISYHLDIMRKANLVCCRAKGKSIAYWLNTKVCAIISNVLENWSRGGGSIEASVDKAGGHNVNSFSNE